MKWKSNQHSKLLFFKINWHFDVRLNMYIWKTKFSSLNQYLFDLLLLKKCREDSYRPKYTCYSFWIETSHKHLKVAPAKKISPKCVNHSYKLLWWMLFIPRDNWKTLFFKICCCQEVWRNRHVILFYETSVLKEVHILYPLSPQ